MTGRNFVSQILYRYQLSRSIPAEELERGFLAVIQAAESLHGESKVRLEVRHYLDLERRSCVIGAETKAGIDLNRLFVGHLRRTHGEDSFTVQKLDPPKVDRGRESSFQDN